MRVSVIGCGYLGAVHAACMAEAGHEVIGIDVDPDKVAQLSAGRAPFVEEGLEQLLAAHTASGRLAFSTDIADAADADVHFLAVGTPQQAEGTGADLSALDSAFDALLRAIDASDSAPERALIVGKSTVPVGTAQRLHDALRERGRDDLRVAWSPEFLREGRAVEDTLRPDRIVHGVADPERDSDILAILDEVHAAQFAAGARRFAVGFETAELVKVAANSLLATKISFINAMAEMCDRTGGDVVALADAIGCDERIGRRFLHAGIGFGGGCLPKDIRAFMTRAGELGAADSLSFLREIDLINARARQKAADKVASALDNVLPGRTVTVLGAAFKPHSDDIRDSPSLSVARKLAWRGARVRVTDPAALPGVRRTMPMLDAVDDLREAVTGADVLVLGTEWPEFVAMDPEEIGSLVAQRIIVDGRNALDPQRWRAAGWTYCGTGR